MCRHSRQYHLDSREVRSLKNFVILFSLLDTCIVMLDAVGFHGCSVDCYEAGGPYSNESSHFRGHLGPTFYVIRWVFGVLSDLVYIAYIALSFRTTRKRRESDGANSHTLKQTAVRYLKTGFVVDFLACAPFYWMFFDIPWLRANRAWNFLMRGFDSEEAAKWFVNIRMHAKGQLLHLAQFVVVLLVYVHVMTCATMLVSWSWLSSNDEEPTTEILRWLDIDDTERAEPTSFLFFYFHCSLWVWSNVSGWGGNWSPHSPVTSGWTYMNQVGKSQSTLRCGEPGILALHGSIIHLSVTNISDVPSFSESSFTCISLVKS
jgi:hypothetical protein